MNKVTVTVLHKESKPWSTEEVNSLVGGLNTAVSGMKSNGHDIILYGGYSEKIVASVIGHSEFKTKIVEDAASNKNQLPFIPSFA